MKAIAIVDMPDDVFDIYEELTIRGNINFDGEHLLVMTLKPLPERDENVVPIYGLHGIAYQSTEYARGWNDCLDEITGETDDAD